VGSGRTTGGLWGEVDILWLGNDVWFVKIALKTNTDFLEHVNHRKILKKSDATGCVATKFDVISTFLSSNANRESHGLRLLYTVKVVYVRVQSVWLRALQANAETWQGICKFHFIFRWNSFRLRRNDLYLSLSKHITSFLFLSLLFFRLALAGLSHNCVCGSQQKSAVKDFMNIRLCDPLALLHEANTNRLRQKNNQGKPPKKETPNDGILTSFHPPFHICLDNGVHCVGASTFWFQIKSNVRLCVLFLNNQLYLFYHS
jgi:hypothetical protein